MKTDEIVNQIKNIDDYDDLRTINTVLNGQWKIMERNRKNEFKVGDIVRLTDRGILGIIRKINPKTIDVETESLWGDQIYRCSPSLIQKVENEDDMKGEVN
mgnify:CR=1 FL=1